MSPWDWVTAAAMPPGVGCYALDATPYVPYGVAELPDIQAPVPPGEMAWLGGPNVDSTGKLATRELGVTFGGLSIGQSAVNIMGFAIVDQGPPPDLLLMVTLQAAAQLSSYGAKVVVRGPVVVVRQD